MVTQYPPISIYIHIPFCTRKCPYCQFYSVATIEKWAEKYEKALFKEIEQTKHVLQNYRIETLYLGGGTPFLMAERFFESLLHTLNVPHDLEITVEANPETVTFEKAKHLRNLGINRISIGLQSCNDNELLILGRRHTVEKGLQAINTVSSAGFSNISIDLMYELPQQTLSSWQKTLDTVVQQPITHISIYNLVIEEGTPFHRKEKSLRPLLPGNDIGKTMYENAIATFAQAGFKQYEISAFAKQGLQSNHNVGYWSGREFIGFGPSAWSYLKGRRIQNNPNIADYCSPDAHQQHIDEDPIDKEERLQFILHLRLLEGAFLPQELQNKTFLDKLEGLARNGLLCINDHHVQLSHQGILFYDTIASELL